MDMSFRTMQRFGFVSSLALASVFAAACGDDEKKDKDNGEKDAAVKDAAPALGELQAMCATVCDGVDVMNPFPDVAACCLADNSCGLSTMYLQGESKPECVPPEAPGVPSQSCGEIWDQIDFMFENPGVDAGFADNKIDGKFTTPAMGPNVLAHFNGCCTKAGACSIDFSEVNVVFGTAPLPAANVGYGCVDPVAAGMVPAAMAAGFGETIGCDPVTGEVTEKPQLAGDPDASTGDPDASTGDPDASTDPDAAV